MTVAGPTIAAMIAQREGEQTVIVERVTNASRPTVADFVLHPELMRQFKEKVVRFRETLADELVRDEAVTTIRMLIDGITVRHATEADGAVAEVAASTSILLGFAPSTKNPRRSRDGGCSVVVVAGTGFEPVTFRL